MVGMVVHPPWIVDTIVPWTTRILATAMTGTRADPIADTIATSVYEKASIGMQTESSADRIAIGAAMIAIVLKTAAIRTNRGALKMAATSHRALDPGIARDAPLLIRRRTLNAIVSALTLMMNIQAYAHF